MSGEIWAEGAITIVLLPSDQQGDELLSLAREWTQHGIISPAMWVNPADITVSDSGPPEVLATLIASDRAGGIINDKVRVFDVLAVEALRVVRLIKVRSALPNQESDSSQDAIAENLSRYIALAMPHSGPQVSAAGDRLELIRLTLICAPTEFRMAERVNAEVRDGTTLVVASPEDRATPLAGDAFVRDNERFQGFVLMHTATIGGLWAGMPVGSFELFDKEASLSHAIWIPRVFASGVLTGGLSQRVAGIVLHEVNEHGVTVGGAPVLANGTALIPPSQVDVYVDRLLQTGMDLDDRALQLHPPAGIPAPEQRSISIFYQLGHFLGFSLGKLAKIPHWIIVWFHDGAARRANRRFQGDDGKFSVEVFGDGALDTRDQNLIDSVQRASRLDADVRQRLGSAPTGTTRRATPRLWSGLRQLAFGTLDGGEGVRDVFETIESRTPVFGDPSVVVPNPKSRWQHPGVAPAKFPDFVDWRRAREEPPVRDLLLADCEARTGLAQSLGAKLKDAQSRMSEAAEALEVRERELVDVGLLKYRADGRIALGRKVAVTDAEDDTDEDAPATQTPQEAMDEWRNLNQRATSLTHAASTAEADYETVKVMAEESLAALASFDEWRAGLAGSFGWRLLDRVDEVIVRGSQDLAQAESATGDAPESGELVRLRKRFHRGMFWWTFTTAIIVTLVVFLPQISRWLVEQGNSSSLVSNIADTTHRPTYPLWWQILLVGIAVYVVILLGLLTAYYRGWSRFERNTELVSHRLDGAATRVAGLRVELDRLRAQREQLVEWIHILASAVHKPWDVPAKLLESGISGLDVSRLPFALHLATAIDGPGTGAERLRESAATAFLRPGWRSAAFEILLDEVRHRLGQDAGRFGVDALDSDLPDASNGSRMRLQAHLDDEEILQRVAERLIGDLVDEVQDRDVYEADIAVRPMRADPLAAFRSSAAATDTTWKPFLTGTLGTALDIPTPLSPLGIAPQQLQQAYHEDVTTYVLAPQRIARDLEAEARKGTIVHAYPSDSSSALDMVVRIDMVGPVPVAAIGLWSGVDSAARGYSAHPDSLRCSNCGKSDCPAADPTLGLLCSEQGI